MSRSGIYQAVKFSIVGILNTAVDYTVFYVMLSVLNLDKSISQVIATALAMCTSYTINKYWTFGDRGKDKLQIIKFILTNIVSMSLTIVFMNIFHDVLFVHEWANNLLEIANVSYRLNGDVAVMFCKIVASVFSLVVNFLGNKFWVFKGAKKE